MVVPVFSACQIFFAVDGLDVSNGPVTLLRAWNHDRRPYIDRKYSCRWFMLSSGLFHGQKHHLQIAVICWIHHVIICRFIFFHTIVATMIRSWTMKSSTMISTMRVVVWLYVLKWLLIRHCDQAFFVIFPIVCCFLVLLVQMIYIPAFCTSYNYFKMVYLLTVQYSTNLTDSKKYDVNLNF